MREYDVDGAHLRAKWLARSDVSIHQDRARRDFIEQPRFRFHKLYKVRENKGEQSKDTAYKESPDSNEIKTWK
jgi:hypothetical protein